MAERSEREPSLPREIGGIKEIIASPQGWSPEQVSIVLNLTSTEQTMQESLNQARQRTYAERVQKILANGGTPDEDRPKVWLRGVSETNNQLTLIVGQIDYFALWGLPGAAPNLHRRFLNELPERRTTEVPNGISTHNIIVTSDNHIVMAVRSRNVAFSAGRTSVSFEEQMEPEDGNTFQTVVRGLQEEFGITTPVSSIRLLGLGAEKGSAYTSACHISELAMNVEDIARLWETAQDNEEGSALLAVPQSYIDVFSQEGTSSDIWSPFVIAGTIPQDAKLQPHPTVPWRITLLQEYTNRDAAPASV